ncbi:hypothetical protein RN001_012282 [Aquatica leii]|nr:hypothetical protein RN001_012282 [Aquatica leii]
MSCMVVGCGSTGNVCNILQERREKWIGALRRADLTEQKLKYGRICSKHFITGKPAKLTEKNHPDGIQNKNSRTNF